MMRKPIILLLCLCLLMQSVAAEPAGYTLIVGKQSWTALNPSLPGIHFQPITAPSIAYNLTPGALYYSTFFVQPGQTVSFTYTRMGGEELTGSVSVQTSGYLGESVTKTITLEGETSTITTYYVPYITTFSFTFIGAYNTSAGAHGFMVYDHGTDSNLVFAEKTFVREDMVNLVAITPDTGQATVHLYFGTPYNYGADAGPGRTLEIITSFTESATEVVTFTITALAMTWFVFTEGLYWFNFFFIDNAMLTIVLVETGGLALCAVRSRDIFEFFRKAWDLQMKIFGLFLWFIEKAFQILEYVKNIVWPG